MSQRSACIMNNCQLRSVLSSDWLQTKKHIDHCNYQHRVCIHTTAIQCWTSQGPIVLTNPVIRCLFGNRHVMNMRLIHTGTRDSHKLSLGAHFFNIFTAGIAHAGS